MAAAARPTCDVLELNLVCRLVDAAALAGTISRHVLGCQLLIHAWGAAGTAGGWGSRSGRVHHGPALTRQRMHTPPAGWRLAPCSAGSTAPPANPCPTPPTFFLQASQHFIVCCDELHAVGRAAAVGSGDGARQHSESSFAFVNWARQLQAGRRAGPRQPPLAALLLKPLGKATARSSAACGGQGAIGAAGLWRGAHTGGCGGQPPLDSSGPGGSSRGLTLLKLVANHFQLALGVGASVIPAAVSPRALGLDGRACKLRLVLHAGCPLHAAKNWHAWLPPPPGYLKVYESTTSA